MIDFLERAMEIKAEALAMDTSQTTTVKMSDLCVGDVVLQVGPKSFPFPFTLSKVEHLTRYHVVMLAATHGWFNMRPYPANDTAVIVCRWCRPDAPDDVDPDTLCIDHLAEHQGVTVAELEGAR